MVGDPISQIFEDFSEEVKGLQVFSLDSGYSHNYKGGRGSSGRGGRSGGRRGGDPGRKVLYCIVLLHVLIYINRTIINLKEISKAPDGRGRGEGGRAPGGGRRSGREKGGGGGGPPASAPMASNWGYL